MLLSPPVVDVEAEATTLFETHAPTLVAVILIVAGFAITLAVLRSVIRRIGRGFDVWSDAVDREHRERSANDPDYKYRDWGSW